MNRWGLYEVLKCNRIVDNQVIDEAMTMNPDEIREGVLEYLQLMKQLQNRSPPEV
jgi:hypothetical protein